MLPLQKKVPNRSTNCHDPYGTPLSPKPSSHNLKPKPWELFQDATLNFKGCGVMQGECGFRLWTIRTLGTVNASGVGFYMVLTIFLHTYATLNPKP